MVDLDVVLKLPKVRKIKTSVALPSDLLPKAHQIAERYGLSMSEYLSRILRADVEKRKLPSPARRALDLESALAEREQIRAKLSLPMAARMNFLRIRRPEGGSHL